MTSVSALVRLECLSPSRLLPDEQMLASGIPYLQMVSDTGSFGPADCGWAG
jgi:hypothetical protein